MTGADAGMTGGRLQEEGVPLVVVTGRTLEPGEKPVQRKQCGQWGYQHPAKYAACSAAVPWPVYS